MVFGYCAGKSRELLHPLFAPRDLVQPRKIPPTEKSCQPASASSQFFGNAAQLVPKVASYPQHTLPPTQLMEPPQCIPLSAECAFRDFRHNAAKFEGLWRQGARSGYLLRQVAKSEGTYRQVAAHHRLLRFISFLRHLAVALFR